MGLKIKYAVQAWRCFRTLKAPQGMDNEAYSRMLYASTRRNNLRAIVNAKKAGDREGRKMMVEVFLGHRLFRKEWRAAKEHSQ